ncbi:MAG: hypothetical protein LPD71_06725 [Shewanella sp.]|nr:hypothetical protein [Shewanella sp.]MCF1430563.1 hypothetical protein [Shewanella sp.]MCF1438436.1 hypothetical protein [Shewanella sp.]MCF1459167.1 hypothetical protein [Shewanella sp.]
MTQFCPPLHLWQGNSEALLRPAEHPRNTEFELSSGRVSPDYDATMVWLEKLIAHSPMLNKVDLGKSPQGGIWMVIATANGAGTAAKLIHQDKPTVML